MRVFVTLVLMVFAVVMCLLYARETSLNATTRKQITELTQRITALETQQQNVKVLKSDIRTLDVKIDTLREALTTVANSPEASLPVGRSNP
ncbi:MAG TPA: hypothetical protein VFB43_19345 [Terracidiphilus sp.]|nr:hypothetical protein [Terracidiphilus sp.]